MKLISRGNDFIEVANNVVTFGLRNAYDLRNKAWIEEQRLPACHWMSSNKRMLSNDGITSHWSPKSS